MTVRWWALVNDREPLCRRRGTIFSQLWCPGALAPGRTTTGGRAVGAQSRAEAPKEHGGLFSIAVRPAV